MSFPAAPDVWVEISKIAVIGAGLMGRGIAHVAVLGGYQVAMVDVNRDVLEKALAVIQANLEKGVKIGKVDPKDMEASLRRIRLEPDMATAVVDADLVIEAVPEDLELKQKTFRTLDQACPPRTILATNTSVKSITEIASVTKRQDRVIGMHFFNPVHLMKLVEVIRGIETSDEACLAVEEVARQMDKETVRVNESPGFIASRISCLVGNEAFYMLQEGVASAEDIDKAVKLGLNYPMGPLELADMVGLDTRLANLEYLHQMFGEKFRPCPLMVKYVKAGRLGRKVGKGVYDYTDKK